MRSGSCSSLLAGLLAACASSGTGAGVSPGERIDAVGEGRAWVLLWPDLADPAARETPLPDGAFPARMPSRDQLATLRDAEQHWRARDDAKFEALRAQAVGEPLQAFWLARLLIRDLLLAADSRPADAAALVGDPPWQRPFEALVSMGTAAVPCVVLDLVRSSRADRRDVGARVLAAMGPEALPAWSAVLRVDDARGRRAATRALGQLPEAASVMTLLSAALDDPDLGVRAEALRGLGRQGQAGGVILRSRLGTEQDSYLQRAIVEGLGWQRDRESAAALVQYLSDALARRDQDGVAAARAALRRMSGRRDPGSLATWQQWLADHHPDGD